MRRGDAVDDKKPEMVSPVATPSSIFNPNSTVLELILKLRSCFQLKDSEQVATILQSRQDKLKQAVEDLKLREDKLNQINIDLKSQMQTLIKKCTALDTNHQQLEAELKKSKSECKEYRDNYISVKYELEKVRLDLNMAREKEDIANESYEERIADFNDESERLRAEIVKIRDELDKERVSRKEGVVALYAAKRKAEDSAKYWEKNYKQCEPRLVKLEKDISIMLSDPVLAKIVDKAPLLHNPSTITLKSVGNAELVEQQKPNHLSECDEDVHASLCSTAELLMIDANGPAEAGPNSSVMDRGNRGPMENQVVIEIGDSDDEKPIIETASASKADKDYGRSSEKDPVSQSISRGKLPLVQNNGRDSGVDGSSKCKKRKMDSPLPNKTDGNDSSDESITTVDMEKLVSKILKNKPFKFEVEMLTAFNKDDELCLNAVCVLHRVGKCDKLSRASQYRGFNAIDATRGYHLANFLVDGDPQGKLRKSVRELQQYASKGIDECRKLARNHLKQLFQIYQKEEDPFFKEYLVKNYSKKTIS